MAFQGLVGFDVAAWPLCMIENGGSIFIIWMIFTDIIIVTNNRIEHFFYASYSQIDKSHPLQLVFRHVQQVLELTIQARNHRPQ